MSPNAEPGELSRGARRAEAWASLLLLALLAAYALRADLVSARGEVGEVTLTSDAPGTLEIE